MPGPTPAEFGLSEAAIEDIRLRDRRQARLFVALMSRGVLILWLVLSAWVYSRSFRGAPWLGLLMAPLLGGLAAMIGGLPLAVLSAAVSWLRHPPHPQAGALERFEAASAGVRACDVCLLARGDDTVKERVSFCGRCDAWICPDCRQRYDLRAIAALKRARQEASDST